MFPRITALFTACFALSACVTPYTPTPYDRDLASVETIAVIDDMLPVRPTVTQAASAGASFGLVGALIDAGVDANREGRFKEMLAEQEFEPTSFFKTALTERIVENGYAVELIAHEREKPGVLESYEGLVSNADAYLDIAATSYGYLSSGAGQPWRPSFVCEVQLVSRSDGAILMKNAIVYNPISAREGVIQLTPDPAYNFRNIKEIEENPEKAVAGLEDAMLKVADTIATLLN